MKPACRDQYGALWYNASFPGGGTYEAVAVYGGPETVTKDGTVLFSVTLYNQRTADPAHGYDSISVDVEETPDYSDGSLWAIAREGVHAIETHVRHSGHLLKWDVLAKLPTCQDLPHYAGGQADTSKGYSIDLDGLRGSDEPGEPDYEYGTVYWWPGDGEHASFVSREDAIDYRDYQTSWPDDKPADEDLYQQDGWYFVIEGPNYSVHGPFDDKDEARRYYWSEFRQQPMPDESKGYGIDLNGLRGSDQDVQAGFEVSIEHQDVIADNVRDRFSDPSPERDDAIREDLIDANAEITEHGWEQLNEDILRLETNATRWLRETFNGVRVDGHDSTDTLVGSIWFNPYDTKQAELIELASPSPGRSERIDMVDRSYGDLADTVFKGVSDFGQSVLGGQITFFGVPPEAWAVIEGAVEDASGGYQIDLNGLGAVARQPELAPPRGTVAYGRLLKELRAVDPEVRLVHASAGQIAFRAELAGNDPLREKAGYPARGPAATVVIYDLERKDTQNLERLLAQWAAVENPPRLLLAPEQGTNIEWLRQYAVWPGGLGQVSMDADDELVYGGSDQEPDEDEVEDESEDDDGSDEPEECNHDPSRFFGIDDGWYDLTTDNTEDEIERAANGVGGISFGRTGRSQGKYDVYHPWVQPQNCSGGDYDNCGLVCQSNHRVLVRACNNALKGDDTCQLPWFVELYGGHGSYGILIHARRAPDSIAEMLAGLSDYPLLDESDHSELEMEGTQEAWSDWGRDDYRRALEKAFSDAGFEYDFDDVEDAELDRHFDEIANEIGEYWHDDGGSMYIDVEKVAKSAAEDNDLPEGAKAADADEDDGGSGAPPSGGYKMALDGLGAAATADWDAEVELQRAAEPAGNNNDAGRWVRPDGSYFKWEVQTGMDEDGKVVIGYVLELWQGDQKHLPRELWQLFTDEVDVADELFPLIGAKWVAIQACLYELARGELQATGRKTIDPGSAVYQQLVNANAAVDMALQPLHESDSASRSEYEQLSQALSDAHDYYCRAVDPDTSAGYNIDLGGK